MKRILISLVVFLLCCAAGLAQTVSNVTVAQEGSKVVVSYDIDKESTEVQLTVSTDGGRTFSAPLKMVTGDVRDVRPGTRRIVWDVLSEWDKLTGDNIVFNVIANSIDYVDLGLSVKWATCNLGASNPEESGGYYQWAGLQDVLITSTDLDWSNCPYHTGSDENTGWTKYVPSNKSSYWSGSGRSDNKTVLDPEDDIAHIKLSGNWRMPTDAEWTELRNNCIWIWTTLNGVKGYKVTSKKYGYTSKSIFLPAAGCCTRMNLTGVSSDGYYWSSSLAYLPFSGAGIHLHSSGVFVSSSGRYIGRSVRPVSE